MLWDPDPHARTLQDTQVFIVCSFFICSSAFSFTGMMRRCLKYFFFIIKSLHTLHTPIPTQSPLGHPTPPSSHSQLGTNQPPNWWESHSCVCCSGGWGGVFLLVFVSCEQHTWKPLHLFVHSSAEGKLISTV